MKLWILRPIDGLVPDPWDNWYDKYFGFVVRAKSEDEARLIVSSGRCGDEGKEVWLDPSWTSCKHLTGDGNREVIIADFRGA